MLAMGEYAADDKASTMKDRDYKDATDLVVGTAFNVHGANSCAMKGNRHRPSCRLVAKFSEHAPCLQGHAVRRLTPLECEKLQGFPPHYTLIEWKGPKAKDLEDYWLYLRQYFPDLTLEQARKFASDSPRYRGLGNSMAVPVMKWLGERIQFVDDILQKLKS